MTQLHLLAVHQDQVTARVQGSVRDDHGAQGTHTLYKFRLALPTGETRVANIAIAPLMTRDFAVVGRIILIDDITDRIELESQLAQAEKLSSIGLLAAS